MQLVTFIESLFQNPPIPYQPAKHSLKGWAKYCLQNSGLKVVYAQEADFAIELKGSDKIFIKVTDIQPEIDGSKFTWLVFDSTHRSVQVMLPTA